MRAVNRFGKDLNNRVIIDMAIETEIVCGIPKLIPGFEEATNGT